VATKRYKLSQRVFQLRRDIYIISAGNSLISVLKLAKNVFKSHRLIQNFLNGLELVKEFILESKNVNDATKGRTN
jgi:hypothetical protein